MQNLPYLDIVKGLGLPWKSARAGIDYMCNIWDFVTLYPVHVKCLILVLVLVYTIPDYV